ncbi:MAG: lipopolysaccharide transport periplasmic protein LptA [Steroidobacteraceae bacterium]|jgi:lipopolysaccharide export system protein LptA
MAVSTLKVLASMAMIAAGSQALAAAAAAVKPAQQTIALDAQSSEFDFRNNNLVFHKVRIAQGPMSVAADQAQATGLDFENSHWIFRGNVVITLEQGELTSDSAEVTFARKLLAKAIINGNPAQFQQRVAKTGRLAQGRADLIEYDVGKGIVRLAKNAWLSDGQNEIRGESLKYNVLDQRILAEAAEQNSQRVHIIITPPASPKQ